MTDVSISSRLILADGSNNTLFEIDIGKDSEIVNISSVIESDNKVSVVHYDSGSRHRLSWTVHGEDALLNILYQDSGAGGGWRRLADSQRQHVNYGQLTVRWTYKKKRRPEKVDILNFEIRHRTMALAKSSPLGAMPKRPADNALMGKAVEIVGLIRSNNENQARFGLLASDSNYCINKIDSKCASILEMLEKLKTDRSEPERGLSLSAEIVGSFLPKLEQIAGCLPYVEDPVDRGPLAKALARFGRSLQTDTTETLKRDIHELAGVLSDVNPRASMLSSIENGDLRGAFDSLHRLVLKATNPHSTEDTIEEKIAGFVKSLWTIDRGLLNDSSIEETLDVCLKEVRVTYFIPNVEAAYQPSEHRVVERKPARPGEALNRVIEVLTPGFRCGDEVMDKAQVVISD